MFPIETQLKDISKIMAVDDTLSRDESGDIQLYQNLPSRYEGKLDSAVSVKP